MGWSSTMSILCLSEAFAFNVVIKSVFMEIKRAGHQRASTWFGFNAQGRSDHARAVVHDPQSDAANPGGVPDAHSVIENGQRDNPVIVQKFQNNFRRFTVFNRVMK